MLKLNIVEQLKNIVGQDSLLTAKEDLATYAYDGTTTWSHPPDAVVLPTNTQQVSSILALANENRIPVTPADPAPISAADRSLCEAESSSALQK